jgi:hypothetical protein
MRIGMGLGITQCGGGGPPWFYEADFENVLPLSTSANGAALTAAMTAMGFTLTRPSTATVQTGPSAVVTGIAADVVRVGNGGYGQGVCLEEERTNLALQSQTIDAWSNNAASVTSNTTVAPDGTTTADYVDQTVNLGPYDINEATTAAGLTKSVSTWYRYRATQPGKTSYLGSALDNTYKFTLPRTSDLVWYKESATHVAMTTVQLRPWILRGTPAFTDEAQLDVWGVQVETGRFPTEYIPTTAASTVRSKDQLVYNGDLVSNGRIAMEFKFIPKVSSVEHVAAAATMILWQASTSPFDFIAIGTAANAHIIRNSVAAYNSNTTLMTWARGDVIEMFVEGGGGVLASRAWYRKNGGATIALDTGGIIATNMQTSPTNYVLASTGSITNCWAQRVRAYTPGRRPAWI